MKNVVKNIFVGLIYHKFYIFQTLMIEKCDFFVFCVFSAACRR